MKLPIAVVGLVLMGVSCPPVLFAQQCPPELAQAKSAISSTQGATSKGVAQTMDVQAPRTAAGFRSEDGEAPRGQDTQAPRGQDAQAPRGQDTQAPRVAAGARGADQLQPKIERAQKLVAEAELACQKGDMPLSSQLAGAAVDALK